MNSQLIVIVQVLIAVVFVLWIFSRRGGSPKPTVLNMTDKNIKPKETASKEMPLMATKLSQPAIPKYSLKKYDSPILVDEIAVKAKALNVIFMWNGHSWDAYEVLGVPAGAPIAQVRMRFQAMYDQSDEGQKLFLSEALRAIENKVSSH
ncbi:MAG: hypothetical protein JNL11_00985 [Bdellovibrionaceae bacterium]|nr:hypothetical protein [Pseudobdellovibrionaceae bacterium]